MQLVGEARLAARRQDLSESFSTVRVVQVVQKRDFGPAWKQQQAGATARTSDVHELVEKWRRDAEVPSRPACQSAYVTTVSSKQRVPTQPALELDHIRNQNSDAV